jgi:hypothetical protein
LCKIGNTELLMLFVEACDIHYVKDIIAVIPFISLMKTFLTTCRSET